MEAIREVPVKSAFEQVRRASGFDVLNLLKFPFAGTMTLSSVAWEIVRAVGYTKVRMHMRVETRSDPIGRRLDAFITEIDFGLPPMMRHMNVQG